MPTGLCLQELWGFLAISSLRERVPTLRPGFTESGWARETLSTVGVRHADPSLAWLPSDPFRGVMQR